MRYQKLAVDKLIHGCTTEIPVSCYKKWIQTRDYSSYNPIDINIYFLINYTFFFNKLINIIKIFQKILKNILETWYKK